MKVSELKIGTSVTVDLVLASAAVRQTKSTPPRDFLTADFTDGENKLEGKIWNYVRPEVLPETGKVYTITGDVGEYQGKKQITLKAMSLSADQDMTRFLCMYVSNPDVLLATAFAIIQSIQNDALRNITKNIYMRHSEAIKMASSAKTVHHVGIGGNLFHSVDTCNIGIGIAEALRLPDISLDLIKAGALLHDIGKPFVYTANGASVDYTLNGTLFEHIVNGVNILDQAAQELDNPQYNEAFSLLQHIIASHHGELEYGSPVTPKFIEAYIVHWADDVSAKSDILMTANKQVDETKIYTDKIFYLNNQPHLVQREVLRILKDCEQSL